MEIPAEIGLAVPDTANKLLALLHSLVWSLRWHKHICLMAVGAESICNAALTLRSQEYRDQECK